MDERDCLQCEINYLVETIQEQQERYELATRSLKQAKASLEQSDKIGWSIINRHPTREELICNLNILTQSVNIVTAEFERLLIFRIRLSEYESMLAENLQ